MSQSRMSEQGLILSKQILQEFGEISNLKINTSKTKVICFGQEPTQQFVDTVENLGFKIDNKFEYLGITLNNKLDNLNENWDKILEKVKRIANFWDLFFLSTPGRINICKTFMYSQLSYLSCIFTPPQYFMEQFKNCIHKFLKNATKVAKSRYYEPIEKGGLGLTDPELFVKSLQCSMFIRGFKGKDTWSLELRNFMLRNDYIFSINHIVIDSNLNPIIKNLTEAFGDFAKGFLNSKGNFMKAKVFQNSILHSPANMVNRDIFSDNSWNTYSNSILNIKYEDIIDENGNIQSYEIFKNLSGARITFPEYIRLAEKVNPTILKLKNQRTLEKKGINSIILRKKVKVQLARK